MADLIDRAAAIAEVTKRHWPQAVEAAKAIAALPAQGVRVKPLVWREKADVNFRKGSFFTGHSLVSFAPVIAIHKKHDGWWLNVDCKTYPTLDAAKAAAQADYERGILAALAPAEAGGVGHASDCAVHNEPAYPAGPCDCGAAAPAPVDALVKAVEAEIDARQAYEAATSGDFPRTKEREWMNARAKVIAALAAYRGGAK